MEQKKMKILKKRVKQIVKIILYIKVDKNHKKKRILKQKLKYSKKDYKKNLIY